MKHVRSKQIRPEQFRTKQKAANLSTVGVGALVVVPVVGGEGCAVNEAWDAPSNVRGVVIGLRVDDQPGQEVVMVLVL